MTVCLLDDNQEVIQEFKPEPVTLDPDCDDCSWKQVHGHIIHVDACSAGLGELCPLLPTAVNEAFSHMHTETHTYIRPFFNLTHLTALCIISLSSEQLQITMKKGCDFMRINHSAAFAGIFYSIFNPL